MMNPVSEELMFANAQAKGEELRRAYGHSSTRGGSPADVRRWWRGKRATRRTR